MLSRRRNRAKKYSYVRLSRRRQQIRLFELAPAASRNDPVFGSLRIVDFDEDEEDVPEFDALSYQWGELTPTYEITIVGDADSEDGSLQVRQNLNNALRDLRLSYKPLVIWIDAICINQQDQAEKKRQLPLMPQIYSSVRTVRCWIDEDVDPDSKAFRALKGFKTAVKNNSMKALQGGNECSDDERRKLRLLGKCSWKFWRPVANVFLNEYWSRIWIQQELLLASCRAFHFRQYVMDDGDEMGLLWFHEIIRQLTDIHPFLSVDDPTSAVRVAANIVKHIYRGRQQESLFGSLVQAVYHSTPYRLAHTWKNSNDLDPMKGSFGPLLDIYLSAQHRLKVTNDRDRVYGMLGLARDCKDVEVRYDISVVQTYAQVFRNHIKGQADLKFLSLTGRPGLPSEWPSWFPRWHLPMPYQRFTKGRDYQASDTSKTKDGWISQDGCLLSVRGICVDRITNCIGASPLEDITMQDLVPLLLHLNSRVISIKDGGRRNKFNRNKGVLSYTLFPPVNDHCLHEVCGECPNKRGFAGIWRMLHTLSKRFPRLRLRDFLDPDLDFRPWPRAPMWRNMWERIWLYRMACWLGPQQLVLTERGLPGTIHKNSETWRVDRGADEVWVLFGCPVPLVLRPERRSRRYRVVSPIYLPGFNEGAIFDGDELKRSLSLPPVTDIVLC